MLISGNSQVAIENRNKLMRLFRLSDSKKDFRDRALSHGYDLPEIILYTLDEAARLLNKMTDWLNARYKK